MSEFENAVFIIGQGAEKTTDTNVRKYDQACKNNYHMFMPFVFNIFRFLTSEVVKFSRRVRKIMNKNILTASLVNIFFA